MKRTRQRVHVKLVSYEYEKARQKKEMNLNSGPPAKAPVCANNQPIDNGAWRKEEKSQKQNNQDSFISHRLASVPNVVLVEAVAPRR